MTPWLLASGDFVPVGGMDTANHAFASFLARRGGADVHLVAHRVAPELASRPGVHVHRVPRPFGLHTLGEPLLTSVATRRSRDVLRSGGHVMANGGNLNAGDVAWIHYVHAAYAPVSAGTLNAVLGAFKHRQYLAAERRALTRARLVICNRAHQFLKPSALSWLSAVAASDNSAGKNYAQATRWLLESPIPEAVARMTVQSCQPGLDCDFVLSGLPSSVAEETELQLAKAGMPVVSNAFNSAGEYAPAMSRSGVNPS